MDPKADKTEIFANEIAEADMRAQKIVSENLVETPNAAVAACPIRE
jgi:hypothetical protein